MGGSTRWEPTCIKRYIKSMKSSTGVAVVRTDQGDAYIKTIGNDQGPHALVREFIGTSLASWFGLPTFEYALIEITPVNEIPLGTGHIAQCGMAFATRAHKGSPWDGTTRQLQSLVNIEAITSLVVFDTWVLNVDRFPPQGVTRNPNYDNVFLSMENCEPKKRRLIAMDFTHCLGPASMLTPHVKDIQNCQDERIYGLFPAFEQHINGADLNQSIDRIGQIDRSTLDGILAGIPKEWNLSKETASAIEEFLLRRALFLKGYLPEALRPFIAQQSSLNLP